MSVCDNQHLNNCVPVCIARWTISCLKKSLVALLGISMVCITIVILSLRWDLMTHLTRYDRTLRDMTQHDVTLRDMTQHDKIRHLTQHGKTRRTTQHGKIRRTTQHDKIRHMTQHDKTGHNTTQHDKTRHNTIQHDKTGHNTTQHDKTGHNTTQHDKTGHNTTQHDKTGHNTTQHDKTRHNTIQHDKTGHNTTQHDKTGHNTTQHDKTGHNTTQHDKTRHDMTNKTGLNPVLTNHTQSPVHYSGKDQRKMLIFVCLKTQRCAGWSDRQRAMVSVYLLAQVTNRRFGIMMDNPCDLRNFYQPNSYNWVVDKKELEGRSQRLIYPGKNLSKIDFNQQYPEDVLLAQGNADCMFNIKANRFLKPLLPEWAKTSYYGNYFRAGWHILMKPTPRLQRRLDDMLVKVGFHNRSQPLVGVHVRIGRNPSNPRDGIVFNKVSSVPVLWDRVDPYVKNGSQLFLATDSEQVRQMSKKRFGKAHHDTAGIILHVGKQAKDSQACQGLEDALLDQLVLSYSDVLFRSRGGFSMRAGFMNRHKTKVFVFQNGRVYP